VQFVSAQRGWVVGSDKILATIDGGRRWTTQYRGNLGLSSIDFADERHGWAVGADALLATADSGAHWSALPEPCSPLRQVQFVTPLLGFAIAGGADLYGLAFPLAPLRRGVVLSTTDGGRTWRRLAAPDNAQSVCFDTADTGWLGAGGFLFRTFDGGRSWRAAGAGVRAHDPSYPALMTVRCAGTASAWALAIGPGAAMSQDPHVAFHAGPDGTTAIFAEQYFRNPGAIPRVSSPGSYAGPFSVISAEVAAFIDGCPACGNGTAPWDLATRGGAMLRREGNVGGLTIATGASFLTPRLGWVVGENGNSWRIVSTGDGGRTWAAVTPTLRNHPAG
jgi:photosystem II stability/assembly factor-like uncharacterized protein